MAATDFFYLTGLTALDSSPSEGGDRPLAVDYGQAIVMACTIFFLIGDLFRAKYSECTHIFTIEKDFNKLHEDKELGKYVEPVLERLRGFKVAVHPRIRLFYRLLRRAMAAFARRSADTLYNPSTYRRHSDNVA